MFSRDDFRKMILSETVETKAHFKEKFSQDIETFICAISYGYSNFNEFERGSDKDARHAYISDFIFFAIKTLTESFTIYLSGFPTAAGHLMRQFYESIAMAMLLSMSNDAFQEYNRNPAGFPVRDALKRVLPYVKRTKSSTVNKESWATVVKAAQFYNKYSHAGLLARSPAFLFGRKGVVIGGYFDDHRIEAYRKEIQRYITGAELVINIIEGLRREKS
jgi:hypothetical protein